jgi:hypothetical protein
MSGNEPSDESQDAVNKDLLDGINEAMTSLGWTVPQCEDDVRRAEERLDEAPAPLPASLEDPNVVFNRPDDQTRAEPDVVLFPSDPLIEENLARAAREGGPIPPEIEERMRRDREAAEREDNHAEDGD